MTNGKKQYGYLRYDIKKNIDNIVDELGKDGRIAALYNLWYKSKESALKVYAEELPERVSLSQNKEFKSVKNLVITEAMKLNLPTDDIEEPEPIEPEYEPTFEEIEGADMPQEDADPPNKWQLYRMAKEHLDRDGEHYDPRKAVEYLTQSAKQGYTVAKYMLGKLYLRGEDNLTRQIQRSGKQRQHYNDCRKCLHLTFLLTFVSGFGMHLSYPYTTGAAKLSR